MDDNFLHIILIMFSLLLLTFPIVVIRVLHIVTTPMIFTDVNIEVRERWHALNLGEKTGTISNLGLYNVVRNFDFILLTVDSLLWVLI